jgi:hypothetical protein
MLVVTAVIAIMLVMAIPAMTSRQSLDLHGASLQLAAMFEEARAEAVAFGEPVRILILDDPGAPGDYRRRIIAVRRAATSDVGSDDAVRWQRIMNPMTLAETDGPPHSWLYYEIRSSGSPVSDMRNVVIAAAEVESGRPGIVVPDPEQIAGFRLTDLGRPVQFRQRADLYAVEAGR